MIGYTAAAGFTQLDLAIKSSKKQRYGNFEKGPSNIVSSILSFHCLFIHERIGRDSHHGFFRLIMEATSIKSKNFTFVTTRLSGNTLTLA